MIKSMRAADSGTILEGICRQSPRVGSRSATLTANEFAADFWSVAQSVDIEAHCESAETLGNSTSHAPFLTILSWAPFCPSP